MKRVTWSLAISLPLAGLSVSCADDPLTGPNAVADNLGFNPGELPVNAAAAFPGGIDQLLENGDIESGMEGIWWTGRTSGYDIAASTEHFVSGARSLSISSEYDHGDDNFTFWAQSVRLENPAGLKFTLSVSLKLEDVAGEGISIAIRGDDTDPIRGAAEAFASTQGIVKVDGTSDWTTLDVDLQDMPNDVRVVTIYLIYLPHSTGTVYFDDVKLSVGEATPIVSLQNGAVEDGSYYPDFWWHGGYSGFDFDWSTDFSVSPSHSLKIIDAGAAESSFAFWAQSFKAVNFVRGAITLAASVRLEGVTGNGIAIAIRGDDTVMPSGSAEVFATTQGEIQINGSQEWTEYSVTLPHVPVEIKSITVYLIHLHGTQGTVYFDDVSLESS
jgi:hypothetical protein